MNELYIIAGIIGYLLVGAVVAGLMLIASDGDGDDWDDEVIMIIIGWPVLSPICLVIYIIKGLVWIAKKIGGVK